MLGAVPSWLPHVLVAAIADTSDGLPEYTMADVIGMAKTSLAHDCVVLDQAVYAPVDEFTLLADYTSAWTSLSLSCFAVLFFQHGWVVFRPECIDEHNFSEFTDSDILLVHF